jgi:hypothetical protein
MLGVPPDGWGPTNGRIGSWEWVAKMGVLQKISGEMGQIPYHGQYQGFPYQTISYQFTRWLARWRRPPASPSGRRGCAISVLCIGRGTPSGARSRWWGRSDRAPSELVPSARQRWTRQSWWRYYRRQRRGFTRRHTHARVQVSTVLGSYVCLVANPEEPRQSSCQ